VFGLPVDSVLRTACEIAHRVPSLDGSMQRLLASLHSETNRVGRSYEVFPSPRNVRFNEMEYELPAESGPACLQEVLDTVRASTLNTLFPVEYRYVAADDAWLSPFYDRDSASISVHQYHSVDPWPLFSVVEPIFRRHGGRPHWGKLHTLTAKELAPLYPRWDDFQRVRRRLDPKGRFLNEHLHKVLGVAT
jgi:FAD/FMN-containing dehydrogenase